MKSELRVTLAKVSELIPDPDNARTHSERNLSAIKKSIERFGIRRPIVADEDTKTIWAGNGVYAAALELGLAELPVAWLPAGTPETVCRAYAIADNRTSELAEWNPEQLEKIIADLQDVDLVDIGFSDAELQALLGNIEELDYDALWQGMPEFTQEEKMGFHQVIVHFETEADMNDFAELVGQKITPKTKYIWHPEQEKIPIGRIEHEQ